MQYEWTQTRCTPEDLGRACGLRFDRGEGWYHDGSRAVVLVVHDSGSQWRAFYYNQDPRAELQRVGVLRDHR